MNAKQDWDTVEPSELMAVTGGSGNVAQAAAAAGLKYISEHGAGAAIAAAADQILPPPKS